MSLGAHSSRVEQTRVYTGLDAHFSGWTDGCKRFVGYTRLTCLEPEDIAATIAKRNSRIKKKRKDSCGPALLFHVQEERITSKKNRDHSRQTRLLFGPPYHKLVLE